MRLSITCFLLLLRGKYKESRDWLLSRATAERRLCDWYPWRKSAGQTAVIRSQPPLGTPDLFGAPLEVASIFLVLSRVRASAREGA
jgi:hypothetical protein